MVFCKIEQWKFIVNAWKGLWHCRKYNISYNEKILCSNQKAFETIGDTEIDLK